MQHVPGFGVAIKRRGPTKTRLLVRPLAFPVAVQVIPDQAGPLKVFTLGNFSTIMRLDLLVSRSGRFQPSPQS